MVKEKTGLKFCPAPNCLNTPIEYHVCPYAYELKGDKDECRCCEYCKDKCANNI